MQTGKTKFAFGVHRVTCFTMATAQRRTLSKSDHTAMVDAFRADAPHYRPAVVAKQCGVDPKTAHRAWSQGWPRRSWAPISEMLEAEKQSARAILHERRAQERVDQDAERQATQADIAESIADEANMVRVAQTVTADGLGAVAAISSQARALGELVSEQLRIDCTRDGDDPYKLSSAQGLSMLNQVAKVTKTLLENARQAMEMERLRLGKPTGVDDNERLAEMSVTEAETRMAMANQALDAAKNAGGLRIVDGGKSEPTIGKRVDIV